ncbi:unnamed protein product [Diabrotica balteata]|uniref:CRAL-TRIO domain-containing protein n=1 Tax=Diabrotica balteata TaxID=107213 RepID=A0A9N9XBJ8_DIABA|nr:unnamed protein product [Diabrotica balteata]
MKSKIINAENLDPQPLLLINKEGVRKYWGKSESDVCEILKDLQEWIKKQNFPEMPTNHMIEFFLTNCKYKVEATKDVLSTYYKIRKQVPEIYEDSNPRLSEIEKSWTMGCYCPLPQLTDDLCRISIVKLDSNTSNFVASSYFANIMNIYELRIYEDLCLSEIIICDYSALSWGHVFKMDIFTVRKMAHIMNSLKNRVKQLHIVDSPSCINIIIALAKKLLNKKLADRIVVHKSYDSLYEHVPKDLLPCDYGGKGRPLEEIIDMWKEKVKQYQDRFDTLEAWSKSD